MPVSIPLESHWSRPSKLSSTVMSVNGTMHGNLKREDVAGILAQYKAQA